MCGLKLASPDRLSWEVEAAHIVPSYARGRDDIWNGVALCRLHHWAFDIGWLTFSVDYQIQVSHAVDRLPPDDGIMGGYEFIRAPADKPMALCLPNRREMHPDPAAIRWHNQHVFNRQQRT
jgi:putative restriction endonuclease